MMTPAMLAPDFPRSKYEFFEERVSRIDGLKQKQYSNHRQAGLGSNSRSASQPRCKLLNHSDLSFLFPEMRRRHCLENVVRTRGDICAVSGVEMAGK